MSVYLFVILLYFCVLIGVAVRKSLSVKTQEDFMVAGRRVSTWFLVGTLVCTWVGSGSLFGSAGLAFREGFSALWFSAGAWVGLIVVYFLADRVRRIAEFTVPDILERRYNSTARILGTVIIAIAYLAIAGYQFKGGGKLLNIMTRTNPIDPLTGIDPLVGAAITCGVVVVFTLLAGMVSIMSVDLMNGIIITLSVITAVPLLLLQEDFGGWAGVVQALPEKYFEIGGGHDWVWFAGIFFPTFFLLMGESSIYQKFFAARDAATARRAVIGMVIGVVVIETLLALVAVVGSSRYISNAAFVLPGGGINPAMAETIILHLARFELPELAGALMLAAAVAIILSTANTFLMIPAMNMTRDVYQRFLNPNASSTKIVTVNRLLIVVLAAIAFVVATQFETILSMAFTAYTMVGAGITPVLLASFLWTRVTPAGGVASMISSMVVTIAITAINAVRAEPLLEADYIIIPAVLVSFTSLIGVSLATRPCPREKWEPFVTRQAA